MESPPPERTARERLLDAALHVVAQSGAGHLTLEAVAEGAGVSKGGLLYHFKTKEALLQGLLDRHMRQLEATFTRELEALGGGPNAAVQAYIKALIACENLGLDNEGSLSIVAAVANDPTLLEDLRREVQRSYREVVESHPEPLQAMRLMLAAEGLVLMDIFGITVLDAEQRVAFQENLLAEAGRLRER